MKALVVDDSQVIRCFLRGLLEPEGIEVSEANDGAEALAALKVSGPIDLLMLDWRMPGLDGFDVLCALRAEPRFDNMSIVMVTTETDLEQVTKALDSGADEYIMKPFNRDGILEKLNLLKSKPRFIADAGNSEM